MFEKSNKMLPIFVFIFLPKQIFSTQRQGKRRNGKEVDLGGYGRKKEKK